MDQSSNPNFTNLPKNDFSSGQEVTTKVPEAVPRTGIQTAPPFESKMPSAPNVSAVNPSPPPQLQGSFSPPMSPPSSPARSFSESQPIAPKKRNFLGTIGLVLAIVVLAGLLFFFGKKFLEKSKISSKKVTINYWGLFEEPVVFQQVIEDYEKKHPNIKINYSTENLFEYRERLQRRLIDGTGPDIFRIHQSWVPMFGDLLDFVPVTVFDNQTFEKTFYSSAQESLKYKGRYVGIPLMIDGLALYYNEDILKAAGKAPPKTWDELRETAIALTVRDNQGRIRTSGVALGTTSNIDHWSDIFGLLLLQNGADLKNPAFCTRNSTGEESGEDPCRGASALSFYTIFSQLYRVWDNTLPSSTYAFSTGLLAMYFGPSWRAFEIKAKNPSLSFKTVPVPQLPGRNISWASYWVEAVSKNSKNSQEAWNFLKYLSSPEVLEQLYQTESKVRLYGEPYPRVEMAERLKNEPVIGAYIEQAPYAKNWFLSSYTGEGNDGINEQIIKYYSDAVNAVNQGQQPLTVLSTVTQGVNQVLTRYGVITTSP